MPCSAHAFDERLAVEGVGADGADQDARALRHLFERSCIFGVGRDQRQLGEVGVDLRELLAQVLELLGISTCQRPLRSARGVLRQILCCEHTDEAGCAVQDYVEISWLHKFAILFDAT